LTKQQKQLTIEYAVYLSTLFDLLCPKLLTDMNVLITNLSNKTPLRGNGFETQVMKFRFKRLDSLIKAGYPDIPPQPDSKLFNNA